MSEDTNLEIKMIEMKKCGTKVHVKKMAEKDGWS